MKKSKILSAILCVFMMLSAVSFTVFAEDGAAQIGETPYATLGAAIEAALGMSGTVTVTMLEDIDMTGTVWESPIVSADNYPHLILEGNNKTISGLTSPLFAGTWAGKSGLTIKNLTIKDSNIVKDKDDTSRNIGVGAFVGYPQASEVVTLENCHLVNSSVEGGHWTGGLIGMAGGYSGTDGPVFMNLTVKGCSVQNSTISGKGSVGALFGHATCSAWTKVCVTETEVKGNIITSTGSDDNKAGYLMGTIGAAGQATTVNGVTKTGGVEVSAIVSGNTAKSNETDITRVYGRLGTQGGQLILNGGSYDKEPVPNANDGFSIAKAYKVVKNGDMFDIVGTTLIDGRVSGNDCSYTYSFEMSSATAIKGTVMIALYGSDNELVGIKLDSMTDAATSHELNNENENTITTSKEAASYKIMFWDGLDTMNPLCANAEGEIE